jgi:hypothetical protein
MTLHDTGLLINSIQADHPYRSDAPAALAAARFRLLLAAERRQRRRELTNEEYYGDWKRLEEPIEGIAGNLAFDGVVTRNHYGSLILNAAHALFIDVDMDEPNRLPAEAWRSTLDDLQIVLANEKGEGFRIYRTAAGFRLLATAHEFDPGSEPSLRLMKSVGADAEFVNLCSLQQSFRARLTPKPWRCGMRRPPNLFPRHSADHQRCFANWLLRYERVCRERATCQYLAHIGSTHIHERVAPIVELHDRQTKALEALPLA